MSDQNQTFGFTVEFRDLIGDGFKAVAEQLEDINKKMDESKDSSEKAGGGMAELGTKVGGLVTQIAEGVVTGELFVKALEHIWEGLKEVAEFLPELIFHAEEFGNKLYEMSLKTGASVEGLSRLRFVAEVTGSSFDRLGTTFFMMERALGATGPKADSMAASLKSVGLSLEDIRKMKPEDQFVTMVTALEHVDDRSKQAAVAMQLFGRGARDMMGLFHEDIQKLLKDADDLGLVVSASDAAAAHAADVGWKSFHMQIEAIENKIGFTFMPLLVAMSQLAVQAVKDITAEWSNYDEKLGKIVGDAKLEHLGQQVIVVAAAFGGFIQGASEGLDNLIQLAIRWGQAAAVAGEVWIKALSLGTAQDLTEKTKQITDWYNAAEASVERQEALGRDMSTVRQQMNEDLDAQLKAAQASQGLAGKSLDALRDIYGTLDSLKAPAKGAFDFVADFGKGIESVADNMSGRVPEAFGKAKAAIQEYTDLLDKANKAPGVTAPEDDPRKVKAEEKATEASIQRMGLLWTTYDELVAKESGTGYDKARAAIDKWYDDTHTKLDEGAALNKNYTDEVTALNTVYYQKLVLAQQDADAKAKASLDKAGAAWNDYYKTVQKDADQNLDAQITAINAWYDAQYAIIEKAAKDDESAWDQLPAKNAELWARLEAARHADYDKQVQYATQVQSLWEQTDQIVAQDYGQTKLQQQQAIQRWFDNEVAKIKETGQAWEVHYDALYALAQAKFAALEHVGDPLWAAMRSLNGDMRQDFANTWESVLNGGLSWSKAMMAPFAALESEAKKIAAAILGDFENQLFSPLINLAHEAFAKVFQSVTGSSGSGFSSLLSKAVSSSATGHATAAGTAGSYVGSDIASLADTIGGFGGGSGPGALEGGATLAKNLTGAGELVGSTASKGWLSGLKGGIGKEMGGFAAAGGVMGLISSHSTGGDLLSGLSAGAGIGSMVPGLGTAVGAGIGLAVGGIKALIAHFGPSKEELAGRSGEGDFQKQMADSLSAEDKLKVGTDQFAQALAGLQQQYVGVGMSSDEAATQAQADFKAMLEAEKQGGDAVKGVQDQIEARTQAMKERTAAIQTSVEGVVSAWQAAGTSIPASMKGEIDSLLKMNGLTDQQRLLLTNLTKDVRPNFEQLEQVASKYGITLAGLGPKFEQGKLEDTAKTVYKDFKDLTDAGGDVGGVLSGMKDEIQTLVQESQKFGTAIPDNMRPLIQNLIDTGQLTDDNGKKIDDISKISFEATPLDTSLQSLIDSVQTLIDTLNKVPGAAAAAGGAAAGAAGTRPGGAGAAGGTSSPGGAGAGAGGAGGAGGGSEAGTGGSEAGVGASGTGQVSGNPGGLNKDDYLPTYANEGYDLTSPHYARVGDAIGDSESILHGSTVRDIVRASKTAGESTAVVQMQDQLRQMSASLAAVVAVLQDEGLGPKVLHNVIQLDARVVSESFIDLAQKNKYGLGDKVRWVTAQGAP